MQYEMHNYRKAITPVPPKFRKELETIILEAKNRKPVNTQKLRNNFLEKLQALGWSDGIRVDPTNSKIDITSVRSKIGLCLQTGNMSRFYADLLKLQTLFAEGKIKAAIYVVPKRAFAKEIGQNLVNYERFLREIDIFSKTITVPILVYGIEE